MIKIDISNIDPILLRELNRNSDDYEIYQCDYGGKFYQIAWNAQDSRACVVRVLDITPGIPQWLDAGSPSEAIDRYAIGDVDDP